jgi:hypothetical protein
MYNKRLAVTCLAVLISSFCRCGFSIAQPPRDEKCVADTNESDRGMTIERLLQCARVASGGLNWNSVGVLIASGTEKSDGGTGHWEAIDDIRHGWMRHSSNFGLLHYTDVWGPLGHWRIDPGDGVHRINSRYAVSAAATDEWLTRRGYTRDSAQATFGPVAFREENGHEYLTVSALPHKGDSVELWFDASTFLLDRAVRRFPTSIETFRYSDYREVDGIELPFSIAEDDGTPDDPDTKTVSTYRIAREADDSSFVEPHTVHDWSLSAKSTSIPFYLDEDRIVIEAMLNGKGPFAFLFDTGGHSLLSADAAQTLGLTGKGSNTLGGAGPGTISVKFAKVDRVAFGGLTLTDQTFSITDLDSNLVSRTGKPPLAGILGPEFCERLIVTVDYRRHLFSFQPFTSPISRWKGIRIPITFTGDMPLVQASLNNKPGEFEIDTGNSGALVVLPHWADKNGVSQQLRRGKEQSSRGIGGLSRERASSAKSLRLGNTTLNNIPVRFSEDAAGSFASWTEAGNFGSSVLSHFTIVFDFQRGYIQLSEIH